MSPRRKGKEPPLPQPLDRGGELETLAKWCESCAGYEDALAGFSGSEAQFNRKKAMIFRRIASLLRHPKAREGVRVRYPEFISGVGIGSDLAYMQGWRDAISATRRLNPSGGPVKKGRTR